MFQNGAQSRLFSPEFLRAVVMGFVPGFHVVHKFGRDLATPTTFRPVAINGEYRTPQPAGAVQLRIRAGGNAADTAGGAGAREVTLIGLAPDGTLQRAALATVGAAASAPTAESWIRLLRAFVSDSGTYANQFTGSHVGAIVIEDTGGNRWAEISINGGANFPRGQSEIGAFSVPTGYSALLIDSHTSTDSSKTTTLLFFQRGEILDAAPGYDAMRLILDERQENSSENRDHYGIRVDGPADMGFMARVDVGTAEVDVDFSLLVALTSALGPVVNPFS